MEGTTMTTAYPLYDPRMEHESCGVGAVVDLGKRALHRTVADALTIVERLAHRAGSDATGTTGDGVGILTQLPHKLFSVPALIPQSALCILCLLLAVITGIWIGAKSSGAEDPQQEPEEEQPAEDPEPDYKKLYEEEKAKRQAAARKQEVAVDPDKSVEDTLLDIAKMYI